MSGIELVVRSEFEQYAVGMRITDEAEIARLIAEHPDKVVKVRAQENAPQPAKPNKGKAAQ